MPKVVANGITIHYQQAGDGPDVVLIHGVTGDLSSWYLGVMPGLAGEFRVTAYDLRGHGYSELTPNGYTSDNLATDLRDLLDGLGIERAHLVGYSFGATIALQCAALYPSRVASLALAEPWIGVLRSHLDLRQWPYLEAAKAGLRERGLMVPEDKWLDLEFVARQALHMKVGVGLRRGMARNSRRLLRLLDTTPAVSEALEVAGLTVERLAGIRQPVLAVYGAASPFLQLVPHLTAALPHCRVIVLEGVAHFFAVASPELLVAAVRKFLRELTASGIAKPSGETLAVPKDG